MESGSLHTIKDVINHSGPRYLEARLLIDLRLIRAEQHGVHMAETKWKQADGKVVRIESISTRGRRQLIVKFSYEVSEQLYEGELYTFKSMHEGQTLLVEYDPSNPKMTRFEANYKRTWRIWWFAAATALAIALLLGLWIHAAHR